MPRAASMAFLASLSFRLISPEAGKRARSQSPTVGAGSIARSVSSASTMPMEDITKATTGPKWFQMYLNVDRGLSKELLQRVSDLLASRPSATAVAPPETVRMSDIPSMGELNLTPEPELFSESQGYDVFSPLEHERETGPADLQARAEHLSRSLVESAQQIWLAGNPLSQWKTMDDGGSRTANHFDHVHVSVQ